MCRLKAKVFAIFGKSIRLVSSISTFYYGGAKLVIFILLQFLSIVFYNLYYGVTIIKSAICYIICILVILLFLDEINVNHC